MFIRKYFLFAMFIISLSTGGCGIPTVLWYMAMDYSPEPVASKPSFLHKKGNTEEFVVEITDRRDYGLELLTEYDPDKIRASGGFKDAKPFRWEIEATIWSGDELVDHLLLAPETYGSSFYTPSKSITYKNVEYRGAFSLGVLPGLKSSWFWSKTYIVKMEVRKADERFTNPDLGAVVLIKPRHMK